LLSLGNWWFYWITYFKVSYYLICIQLPYVFIARLIIEPVIDIAEISDHHVQPSTDVVQPIKQEEIEFSAFVGAYS
jgi:hypothetical protein